MATGQEAPYGTTLNLELSTLMNKRKSQGDAPNAHGSGASRASPDKSAQMAEYIGRGLRSMFDGVVAEPVPEKLRQLLEELEAKQAKD